MSDLIINNHIIDAPIVDILKRIKEEVGGNILRTIESKEDYVRIPCPEHKGGNEDHPSCGVYQGDSPDKEYGYTHCFTCGFSGPLYHLVAVCFNKSDSFGKQWLLDRFGGSFVENIIDLPKIDLARDLSVETIDESVLDGMQSFHPYMTRRNLNLKVLEKFKVKYEPKTHSLVFPVWNEKNQLIMLTRRCVNNKQFIIDKDKEKPVYLYNYIKEQNITEVTLVESQINCLTLWGWGYPSVATFGCNITEKQFDILNHSGIRHYFLALDGDSAGDKGVTKFIKHIRKDVFVDIILLPRGKDVNDLTVEEFESLPIISKEEWTKRHK